jgi:hypothetical protein
MEIIIIQLIEFSERTYGLKVLDVLLGIDL